MLKSILRLGKYWWGQKDKVWVWWGRGMLLLSEQQRDGWSSHSYHLF